MTHSPDSFAEKNQKFYIESDDPGLIAFELGVLQFQKKQFRAAELNFIRALADSECPLERRIAAKYNRGCCLLHREKLSRLYAAAIRCFEEVLAEEKSDQPLRADSVFNLELAKLLYVQAMLSEKQKANMPQMDQSDIDPIVQARQFERDQQFAQEETDDQASGIKGGNLNQKQNASAIPKNQEKGNLKRDTAKSTQQKSAGAGTMPILPDDEKITPRSSEDVRRFLSLAQARLEKERRSNNELLSGPEKKGVRDW